MNDVAPHAPQNASRTAGLTRRGFLALTAASLAGLALPKRVWADTESAKDGAIVLLHTNDVHCAVGARGADMPPIGYAAVADYLKAQREVYGEGNVTLLDAGDHAQGSSMGTLTNGEYLISIMNETGYQLACPGNHEFDYGMTQFLTNASLASSSFTYLCCNLYDKRTNTRVLDPYTIREYDCAGTTVRVGFVGATTPATLTSCAPKNFWDNTEDRNTIYYFCEDETGAALVDELQASVDAVREAGADYVVLLAHLGQTNVNNRWRSDVLASKLSGIDVIIDGHSHEEYVQTVTDATGRSVIITQTGTQLASLGQVVINPFAGTISASTSEFEATLLVPKAASAGYFQQVDFSRDEEVQTFIDGKQNDLASITSRVIGTSEVLLRTITADGTAWAVRTQETNSGDFVADAYFYTATNSGVNADFAMTNGGGVRSNIAKGDVTYGTLLDMNPYNNQLCYAKLTGQTILDAFEFAVWRLPAQSGGFLQVSEGVSFTIRTDIESPVVATSGSFVGVDDSKERRVRNVKLHGEAIDPAKEYTVVCHTFYLEQGGGGFTMLANSNPELLCIDYEALIEYVQVNLGGVIGSAYADENGQGRIVLQQGPDPEPTPDPGSDSDPDPADPDGGGDGGSAESGAAASAAAGTAATGAKTTPQTGDAEVAIPALGVAAAAATLAAATAVGIRE